MAVIQKMTSVTVLPLANYANGTRAFGPIDVASDVTAIAFSVQRCTTPNPTIWPNSTTTLEIIPELSTDLGVTWTEVGRTTNAGGIQTARQGGELGFSVSGGNLPAQVGGITRQYRVSTIIAGGPLRTAATAEVT
jgi:hypothetical protein